MTRIKFIKQKGEIIGFEISGHANYAPIGQDIVCASISSTSEMVINGMQEILGMNIALTLMNGYIHFDTSYESTAKRQQAQSILKSFALYVEMLARQYPLNVKYIEKDLDKVISLENL